MNESILTSVKKALGLPAEYTPFDPDIVMFTNGVLADLNQLGVGPTDGFEITADGGETWNQFFEDVADLPMLGAVRVYTHLRVRLLFDPPTTGFLTNAIKEQIAENVWRISVRRESITQ